MSDPERKNPNGLWGTSYRVVFGIDANTMRVAVYGRFNNYYDYSVN